MSFGWSAGDVVLAVKLIQKISQALRDADGSRAQYQNAVVFLKGVESTITGIERLQQTNRNLLLTMEVAEQAESLKRAVDVFRLKIASYDPSLGDNPTSSKAKQYWKKVRLLSVHVEELKVEVGYSQSVVDSLINLQALNVLTELLNKPSVSPKDLEDSANDISRNFPTILSAVNALQSSVQGQATLLQQIQQSMDLTSTIDAFKDDLLASQRLQNSQANIEVTAQLRWQQQLRSSVQEIQNRLELQFNDSVSEMRRIREAQTVMSAHQRVVEQASERVCQLKHAVWSAVTIVGSGMGHCFESCCVGRGGEGARMLNDDDDDDNDDDYLSDSD